MTQSSLKSSRLIILLALLLIISTTIGSTGPKSAKADSYQVSVITDGPTLFYHTHVFVDGALSLTDKAEYCDECGEKMA